MENSICNSGITLQELLKSINHEPAGVAFVEDSGKLCGVVTDGDFRRLLLSGKRLDDTLEMDDLGPFVYAKQGEDIESLLKRSNKKVRIIPIVDEDMHIVDYFRYEHRVHFTPVAEPQLGGNEFNYLSDAFLSTWISSTGAYIDRFESEFSKYCGTQFGIATSNGTVAIHLALKALGVGEGDEVIIPDLTFGATINAVLHANAIPVIVDIEPESWTINPEEIKKAITPKTKAIIPVHIYGQPCDMEAIMAIAKEHNLFVIEDAAESHGAEFKEQKVGSFGDIACFSFFANKIITTGEGGMCLTNSSELNDKMRVLRDHGMNKQKRYWHDEVGYNYRMTNLQAAIGCGQLERIDELLTKRDELENQYKNQLEELGIFEWQKTFLDRKKVVWLVSTLVDQNIRDILLGEFKKNGVDVRPFFYPLSDMPVFQKYVFSNAVSTEVSKKGINLPTVFEKVDFSHLHSILSAEK